MYSEDKRNTRRTVPFCWKPQVLEDNTIFENYPISEDNPILEYNTNSCDNPILEENPILEDNPILLETPTFGGQHHFGVQH